MTRHKYLLIAGSIAGLALRFAFLFLWPHVDGDSLVYIDIATTWLQQGVFGMTDAAGNATPTYIRLPGYPGFLAIAFAIFGEDRLRAVLSLQILFDLATCFIVSALAYELFPDRDQLWRDRAALASFLIAALCPFTANYAALPLTEALEMFFTALAFLCAVKGIQALRSTNPERGRSTNFLDSANPLRSALPAKRWWAACGVAISGCILMRPDGGLVLIAIGVFLAAQLLRPKAAKFERRALVAAGLLVATFALAPLVPWTARNWHTFHKFQPLVPRYAEEAGEWVPHGFDRWQKTWVVDYVSVEDIGWKISSDEKGEAVDINNLPSRAFDSETQRAQTAEILNAFNQTLVLTPEEDAKLAAIADERMAHSRLRYYVVLPLARIADMWLRPRTEMLPLDQRWWEFDDATQSSISVGFAVLNLLMLLAALIAALRFRDLPGYGMMIAFVILRSMLLMSISNPEPRYTLECYPVVFAFAGAAVAWGVSAVSSQQSVP